MITGDFSKVRSAGGNVAEALTIDVCEQPFRV